jgi:hypothetical protein
MAPVPYHVQIEQVREVALRGSAEPSLWQQLLRPYDLRPALRDEKAHILISGVSGRFKGMGFREVSVCVFTEPDGLFLAHAFNSSRFFAWCERTFFHTPYYHARLQVQAEQAVNLHVAVRAEELMRIEMSPREPESSGPGGWEGVVFLPGNESKRAGQRTFYAKLEGTTHTYAFSDQDRVSLTSSPRAPVLKQLINSGFTGREWTVRRSATHAKSKTVYRM